MHYGPTSYYDLGRVAPRSRLREAFHPDTPRRFRRKFAALTPATPTPPTVPAGVNLGRLLRDDWIGVQGQEMLGQEVYALFSQIPILQPRASRVITTDWGDLHTASQQLYAIFQGTPFRASRIMREQWVSGKMMSEELYAIMKSAK